MSCVLRLQPRLRPNFERTVLPLVSRDSSSAEQVCPARTLLRALEAEIAKGRGYEHIVDACRAAHRHAPTVLVDGGGVGLEWVWDGLPKVGQLLESAQVAPQVTPQVVALLEVLIEPATLTQVRAALGLKDRVHVRTSYIVPALAAGLIEMTIPDKPNSRLQKYRLTAKGQALAATLEGKK